MLELERSFNLVFVSYLLVEFHRFFPAQVVVYPIPYHILCIIDADNELKVVYSTYKFTIFVDLFLASELPL